MSYGMNSHLMFTDHVEMADTEQDQLNLLLTDVKYKDSSACFVRLNHSGG